MKYYAQETMGGLREAFEAVVLGWPEVGQKALFGCPCYLASERMFGFLVTGGIVLTTLPDEVRQSLPPELGASPFQAGARTMKSWVRLPVTTPEEIGTLAPLIELSYQAALSGAE